MNDSESAANDLTDNFLARVKAVCHGPETELRIKSYGCFTETLFFTQDFSDTKTLFFVLVLSALMFDYVFSRIFLILSSSAGLCWCHQRNKPVRVEKFASGDINPGGRNMNLIVDCSNRLHAVIGGILRRLEAFVASSIGCGGSDVGIA
ncbi:hypothetical protein Tco_1104864 [Tanacetum coccineum]